MRPGFGNAAFMISRVRRTARLFPFTAWLLFAGAEAICERFTQQDWIRANARRDEVTGSRLDIE
jgi:hypothetical protein